LNRTEYNNTVRDLLGTMSRPADAFPPDDRGAGFDNLASVLSLSPIHLSLYFSAAGVLASEALSNAAQRAQLLDCDLASGGEVCARAALSRFLPRAWRRAVTEAEVERQLAPFRLAVARGDGPELGLRLSLQSVLLSPHFIFRIELDPEPTSHTPHRLSGYELASRLSYFLWSSMPDDELFSAAAAGLSDDASVRAQATRLLANDKAQALVQNFGGQWLHTRRIEEAHPDPVKFAGFDAGLRAAMKAETEGLFREIVFGGLPADQLLTASFTYVNDRLAQHYGLSPVGSTNMTRVDLSGRPERGGLLSQGGFLTVTSHPTRTSPVNRGKWVMNELLCTEVPPPPPGIDVKVEEGPATGASLRQRLEKHREDPSCNGCHSLMDPIGFGLENYDAIGAYRTLDEGLPVDSAGTLPDGSAFSGARDLAALIAADPNYARCVTDKLYIYALGRTPEDAAQHLDETLRTQLTEAFRNGGYDYRELILSLVTSPTFTMRRGEPATEAP
jgi:hypothetical protein